MSHAFLLAPAKIIENPQEFLPVFYAHVLALIKNNYGAWGLKIKVEVLR